MRPIAIHPGSALFGAGLLALVSIAVSAQRTVTPLGSYYAPPVQVEIVNLDDHIRNAVVIDEINGPYVVPPGKILVLTGLGISANLVAPAYLYIDDVFQANATASSGPGNGTNTQNLSFGLTATAGQVVRLDGAGNPYGRAYGYLIDA